MDSNNNTIKENDIISFEDKLTIKKVSGVPFGTYVINYIGYVTEANNYSDLMKYADDYMYFGQNENVNSFESFYQPSSMSGKTGCFNFTVKKCYKTCSNCNDIMGNYNNHFCSECSLQYKFKYSNSEKCVQSCSDIKMFRYKSNCVEKCPDNTFLDESNFICFDDCKDNIYNNKTFNFKKTCVDFDPNLYSDIESETIQYDYSSEMMNGNKIISDIKDSGEEEKEYESFKTDETDFYEKTNECGKFTEETENNQICQYSYKPDDCPENCPFINIQNNLCVNNCDIVNFFNHSCNLNNPSLKLHQNFKNNISKIISSNSINTLLDIFTKNEEDLVVNNKNIKYQITSTKNQKEKIYDDISTIDL